MVSSWPIIIVTGANGGVGFGICQRLLYQLSQSTPSDLLLGPHGESVDFDFPCEGLTLIMACRSKKRAQAARDQLFSLLDTFILNLRKQPGYDGHADAFRKNVQIDIHELDLGMLKSVGEFTRTVSAKYPYVSHLICNAGVAPFERIVWSRALKQFAVDPLGAVTTPMFYTQTFGEISMDGYGWVWQCNLFGHYTLARDLQHLLESPKYPHDARVIWTSSLKALRTYESDDWQLKLTQDPYGASKYQTELIATHLDRVALREQSVSHKKVVRHFISHPGVCHTNIDLNLIFPVLHYLKWLVFHLARLLGSLNHPISYEKGAVAAVWLSLASLSSISSVFRSQPNPPSAPQPTKSNGNQNGVSKMSPEEHPPLKFGSQCDRFGKPIVGIQRIENWNSDEAERLVSLCDGLYQDAKAAEARGPISETASERM
ncbi:3-keto-steroid reductase [Paramarasmius palmivorus]|uniref:3-keto-steroid reductase n=1 Tax=Paramarasmius palmivorus TaxID=297713 RepID=A0AAW0DD89_9AGAR